ncbi:MAG: hypothetical protein DI498_14175 [Paracoccus denitrificans]|nr:MAG: hypothetical protein DI498_14175 [Paracoccus denitrificans]PZO82810.1 MAG: hypothetical protein DI633_14175 [Paracoccus denitrificans]
MIHNVGCWTPGPIALGIATILLAGCATVGSDHTGCPPVVDYPAEFQYRVADELEALPSGTAIEVMLADYYVVRQQARACEVRH